MRSILILFLLLGGCAGVSKIKPQNNGTSVAGGNLETPFKISVIDELNDGKRLYVRGNLSSKTAWNTESIIIRLRALAGLDPIGEAYYPLRDSGKNEISKDEPVTFSISVPAEGLSDYQIELLWGDEAKRYEKGARARLNPPALKEAVIEELDFKKLCANDDCTESLFEVTGFLRNLGDESLKTAKLGISFRGEKSDSVSEVSETLKNLSIAPGARQKLKLSILIPEELSSEELEPKVRILSKSDEI